MDVGKWLRKNISIPFWQYRNGMSYGKELQFVRLMHEKTVEELRLYQLERIRELILYAYEHVPYYRDEWKALGIKPHDIITLDDFEQLPILTKDKIRNNMENILSNESKYKKLIKSGTGGTTDSPIELFYDYPRARMKEAEMHYFREWFGWYAGDRVAFLWAAPQDIPDIDSLKYKIINVLTQNKLFLFSSFMNSEVMDTYVKKINHYKPDILQGYSNPVYILADYILQHDITVHSPRSVVLTAEPCLPFQRKVIEDAFNSEVFMFYGCREGGYVGCECSRHNGFHINCSSIYMEFLTDSGVAKAGEFGNVVFTDLYNFDMPFIRYRIGDLGIKNEESCACGSPLPLMEFFAGRETDVFITPDGDLVPGVSLCDRIIEDCRGISQLQFIQDTVDEMIVNIVKGPDFSNTDLEQLDKRMGGYFKGKLKITKQFVDDIPKEKSGKTRFCISNVKR